MHPCELFARRSTHAAGRKTVEVGLSLAVGRPTDSAITESRYRKVLQCQEDCRISDSPISVLPAG